MKTTGIVRRIDELGRVVIPKEIRKTMRIKVGEELEVSIENDSDLVLRKYSPIKELEKIASEYASVLSRHTECACLVCNNDEIIAVSGDKDIKVSDQITKALEDKLKERKTVFFRKENAFSAVKGGEKSDVVVAPVSVNGDVVGGIILINKTVMPSPDKMAKLAEVGASFLATQIE